jgi:hypothetical protein
MARHIKYDPQALQNLLYQALETELGGAEIYATALTCAQNPELREEWEKYLAETKEHIEIVRELMTTLGHDPDQDLPARRPVRTIGQALVKAMEQCQAAGDPAAAEVCAAECVTLAETKDHLDWELIGALGKKLPGDEGKALAEAHARVEKQEDHHLYHTTGWTRELWIQALGLPAVLPPPEEEKHVETAIGAARAKNARDEML